MNFTLGQRARPHPAGASRTVMAFVCLCLSLLSAGAWAQATTIAIGEGRWPSMAPDGSFVVFDCDGTAGDDYVICLYEIATGILTQHTLPLRNIQYEKITMSEGAGFIAIQAVNPDTDSGPDIYLFERETGALQVVSANAQGEPGDLNDKHPAISRDGRFVVFESDSNNFGFFRPGTPPRHFDLYRYDRQTGVLSRASDPWFGGTVQLGGDYGGTEHLHEGVPYGTSDGSNDGLRMVYVSAATNLVPGDDNDTDDGFVRYHADSAVVRFTVDSSGNECDGVFVDQSVISGDGNVVAFVGAGLNDGVGGLEGCFDPNTIDRQAFLHDLESGQTLMVSRTPSGEEPIIEFPDGSTAIAKAVGDAIHVSRDGRFIAYLSPATNIVPGFPLDTGDDLFVFDRLAGENTQQNLDPSGEPWTGETMGHHFGMSEDGRFLAFDLRDGTGSGIRRVYLRDRGDVLPPTVRQVEATPENPGPPEDVDLIARISDLSTGQANIASAQYRVDAGLWMPMSASDGAFDTSVESVQAVIAAIELPMGAREICVRGTDALGWTSEPTCIDMVVGDPGTGQVGLKIRCLHEPLYPQPGETVTISAQTIDQDGNSVVSDQIELYPDDRDNPVVVAGVDSATTTLAAPADKFMYGCAADRVTESAFSRFRVVDVGAPEVADFPAIPILNHGSHREKIDLLFMADAEAYPDGAQDAEFLANLHELVDEGLFRIPWFVEFQWAFNIWIAREPGFIASVAGLCQPATIPDSRLRFAFADAVGLIHTTDCRDNWLPGRPYTTEFNPLRLQVVAHELGHTVFSLSDEYTTSPTVRFTTPKLPNLFPSELFCRFKALDRGKDPEECRLLPGFTLGGLWIFEPDYNIPGDPVGETRDLMQQTGAEACDSNPAQNCDRYRVGDSEEARMRWKLGRCSGGKC